MNSVLNLALFGSIFYGTIILNAPNGSNLNYAFWMVLADHTNLMAERKGHSDTLLVRELIAGNEKAFLTLFEAYRKDVYSYGLSMLKSQVYAEEITQDVFLKVWLKRETLDETLSFKSYLLSITRNKTLNFLRKAANDQKLREEVYYRSQQSYEPIYDKLQEQDLERIKKKAIAQLPPRRKQIFEMSRNEGKSYEDISSELGISMNTVKSQMGKALDTIRTFLINHHEITVILLVSIYDWGFGTGFY